MKIAMVYIEHPVFNVDKPFSYFVGAHQEIQIGTRVSVNFNNQNLIGYVENIIESNLTKEEFEEENGFELKDIVEVIDNEPILNDELVELAHYLAQENISPLISCYQAILPPSLKPVTSNKVTEKYAKALRFVKDVTDEKLNEKQLILLEKIKNNDVFLREINDKYSVSKLIKLGLVEQFDKEMYRNPYKDVYPMVEKPRLTPNQEHVLEEINKSGDQVFLLEGVTGSGKTEIYLRQAEKVLNEGKNVLVIVPEISLTPQMIKRFKERLNYPIAVLHSQLSNGEKYDEYRRIKREEVRIVIGARSACFAPLKDIGLIIVDEEHSETYKENDNSPCYYMHDIILHRAEYHHSVVIFGSATPSLETKTKALKGIYHQLFLPIRINNLDLPKVEIVDMKKEVKNRNYSILSTSLKNSIDEALKNKQQVILLLNRRGYSTGLYCNKCGYVFKCDTCGMALHYHSKDNKLKCHYCGSSFDKPDFCPHCGNKYLRSIGSGTQKLEEVIKEEFKNANVLRMDLDTVMKKGELIKYLNDFEMHNYDILLGTQIISKGLDFPNVGLVGVIDADNSLFDDDFRSNEKTFQLLTQVVGRCGRGKFLGKAIIQTNNPTSFPIVLASTQNYADFYRNEMNYRKNMAYPPYRYLSTITFQFNDKDKLYKYVSEIKEKIYELFNDPSLTVLGPSEPHIAFHDGKYRYRLILKYKNKEEILNVLNQIKDLIVSKNIGIKFDTSPYQF